MEEIIENEPDNEIIERGYYYKQLKPYFDLFDRDQIKVFFLDDLKEDPNSFFEKLFSFLEVDPSKKSEVLQKKANTSKKSRFPILIKIRRSIRKIIQSIPGGDNLLQKMDDLGIVRAVLNLSQSINRTETDDDKVPDNIKEKLKEMYKEDIKKLEELVDRDLEKVWNI